MGKKQQKSKPAQLKNCTLFVDGMHCASCEVLIEKKLLKQEGIEAADASLKGSKVEIVFEGDSYPQVDQLNEEFKNLGYTFSTKKFKQDERPAFGFKNGSLVVNPKKAWNLVKIVAIFISLLIAFFIFESQQLGKYVSVDSTSSLPAFLVLGLVAGLSSCAALIGGLLLSMTKQWNELYIDSESKIEKAQPHLMFHLGRLIAFTLLGGVLGLIGETLSFNNTLFFAFLTIIVSFVMLILALQMLGIDWALKFKFAAPKSLTRFAADEGNFQGKYMPFGIGAFTFLLPCGFTLIAQTAALTSGSFLQGALIMLFFALGTLPILVAISFSGLALNSKPHLTAKFNMIAGLVIVFFVIYNINGQMNVLGLPSLSDISAQVEQPSTPNNEKLIVLDDSGTQTLTITAKGFDYIPTSSMTIKAGVSTTLQVDNQGILGCGAFMAANGLIDNFVALNNGLNTIDLGKPRKGTYKLTCSMGMVRPVTITVV